MKDLLEKFDILLKGYKNNLPIEKREKEQHLIVDSLKKSLEFAKDKNLIKTTSKYYLKHSFNLFLKLIAILNLNNDESIKLGEIMQLQFIKQLKEQVRYCDTKYGSIHFQFSKLEKKNKDLEKINRDLQNKLDCCEGDLEALEDSSR